MSVFGQLRPFAVGSNRPQKTTGTLPMTLTLNTYPFMAIPQSRSSYRISVATLKPYETLCVSRKHYQE